MKFAAIAVSAFAVTMMASGAALADKKDGVDVDINLGGDGHRGQGERVIVEERGPAYYQERGYTRYEVRPDDYDRRTCASVGPIFFCK